VYFTVYCSFRVDSAKKVVPVMYDECMTTYQTKETERARFSKKRKMADPPTKLVRLRFICGISLSLDFHLCVGYRVI